MRVFQILITMVVFCSFLSAAKADPSVCDSGCEYLVRDFVGKYPDNDERARGHWNCWDKKSKISMACTFIRGKEIEKFSHVYRRKGDASTPGSATLPGSRATSYSQCVYLCKAEGNRDEGLCANVCFMQFPPQIAQHDCKPCTPHFDGSGEVAATEIFHQMLAS